MIAKNYDFRRPTYQAIQRTDPLVDDWEGTSKTGKVVNDLTVQAQLALDDLDYPKVVPDANLNANLTETPSESNKTSDDETVTDLDAHRGRSRSSMHTGQQY
jgi:hypothetical protein